MAITRSSRLSHLLIFSQDAVDSDVAPTAISEHRTSKYSLSLKPHTFEHSLSRYILDIREGGHPFGWIV
jgi:hypothetical protein